ncbi:hypothetical protein Q7P36_000552 [Cladosporium allicinum]
MAARSPHTKGNQEKGSTLPHCSMDPTLALSLLSDNNATQAQKQPVNRQPATNIPPTTAYQTTMDRDLARSLLQNNTPSVPKPTHPKPTQPSKPNQTRNPSTTPGCPAPPPPPTLPTTHPDLTDSSKTPQKTLPSPRRPTARLHRRRFPSSVGLCGFPSLEEPSRVALSLV